MLIQANQLGKRYTRQWIFRSLNFNLQAKEKMVILGANGSGKSTLLKILAGWLNPTEGEIHWKTHTGSVIAGESLYRQIAIATPYLELVEEFTFREMLKFHFGFKNIFPGLNMEDVLEISGLARYAERQIRFFSSGMKQRAKLTLALLSDTSLFLLDEPCSNLDAESIKWYQSLASNYGKERTIIVCSNHQPHEYAFCSKALILNGTENRLVLL